MTCDCSATVSKAAKAECERLCITSRCSRCLTEFLMSARERQRLGRKEVSKPLARMSWHEKRALHLLKSLDPEQLELFVGWQWTCIKTGYRPSFEDAFDYLNEMRAAA